MAGVDLRTGVKPIGVSRGPSGVTGDLGDRGEITGTDALVAVGREPVTRDLDLDAAGVRTDAPGFVEVDGRLAATAPRTWRWATWRAARSSRTSPWTTTGSGRGHSASRHAPGHARRLEGSRGPRIQPCTPS